MATEQRIEPGARVIVTDPRSSYAGKSGTVRQSEVADRMPWIVHVDIDGAEIATLLESQVETVPEGSTAGPINSL